MRISAGHAGQHPPVRVLQHPDLHLAARHRRLDQHLRVVLARHRDRAVQRGPVGDPGDADRRAGPGRLDEHRQPEPVALLGGQRGGAGPQHDEVADRQPVGREQLLGELLVHAGRAGQHAGPDVGHAGHLQQALDGAVLAERPVQHREDDVDPGEHLAGPVRVQDHQPAAGRVARQRQRGAGSVDRGQRAVGDDQIPRVAGAQHPGPVRGDADRHHLVALLVQVGQHAAG